MQTYEPLYSVEKECEGMRYIGMPICRLDYTMSEADGATRFVREYTLASGGSYCDCGYKKRYQRGD